MLKEIIINYCNIGNLFDYILLLKESNQLEKALPEVYNLIGVKHNTDKNIQYIKDVNIGFITLNENNYKIIHAEGDVFEHTIEVMKNTKPGLISQLAALCHDLGKPKVRKVVNSGYRVQFFGHDRAGVQPTINLLRRLKFEQEIIDDVVMLVKSHMRFMSFMKDKHNKSSYDRFIRYIGNSLELLYELTIADTKGNLISYDGVNKFIEEKELERVKHIYEYKLYLRKVKFDNEKERLKPLLSGTEIMDITKLSPGPVIGKIQKEIKEKNFKDKEEALNYIKKKYIETLDI